MRSDLIKPATVELAFQTAPLLRWQDKRELLACGLDPILGLVTSVEASEKPVAFFTPEGDVACFAGVSREDEISGIVWLLATPAITRIPVLFCKEAREWIGRQTGFKVLHNAADPRNTLHMRFLKYLGFKKLNYLPVGPKGTTFVEFAKIVPCANL